MATAAPEEEVVAEEPKKKKPIVLIIGGVVGLIVLIVGIVLGTLFSQAISIPSPPLTLKRLLKPMVMAAAMVTKKAMPSQARRPKIHLSSHVLNTPTCKLNASSWSM